MPYIFWRKYSPPSQNALNPHLFSLFFLQNHWFLRGNGLFCARTVGFWEEIDFFMPEPLVFGRKWTFLCQNRRFLRGNELFCARTVGFWEEMTFFAQEPLVFERKSTFLSKNRWFLRGNEVFYARTVGFWEEMTIYSKKHPGAGDKMVIYSKSLLDIQFCICIFILFFFNFLVKNKNERTYLLSRASGMNS